MPNIFISILLPKDLRRRVTETKGRVYTADGQCMNWAMLHEAYLHAQISELLNKHGSTGVAVDDQLGR